MGFIKNYYELRDATSGLQRPEPWLLDLVGGGETISGKIVNENTVLNSIPFWRCVSLISNTLGTLPFPLIKKEGRRRVHATERPLYRVIHDEPNPEMTSYHFWSTQGVHLNTWGNGYSLIDRNSRGETIHLWPISPAITTPFRDSQKRLVYRVLSPSVGELFFWAEDILHLRAMGGDGLIGYNPIRFHAEAIGLGMAVAESAQRFFGNGAIPDIALKHGAPGGPTLSDTAYDRIIKSWQDSYGGLKNRHKVALLEEGTDIAKVGVDPETAQLLASRKYTTVEMCQLTGVPPHKAYELERSTNNNIEEQGIEWVVDTVRPLAVNIEKSVNQKCLTKEEKLVLYAKLNMDGLQRGDSAARKDFYSSGRQWSWLTPNDVREKEDLDPIDNPAADELHMPLNMVPLSQVSALQSINQKKAEADKYGTEIAYTPDEKYALAVKRAKDHFAAEQRRRIRDRYRPAFDDFMGRIVRREKDRVMKAVEANVRGKRGAQDLKVWLDDFYATLPEYIKKQAQPTFQMFVQDINESAAGQTGIEPYEAARIQECAAFWATGLGDIYSERHKEQLQRLLNEAIQNNQDVYETLETRTGEWEEKQPGKTWAWETVFISAAVCGRTWADGGFTTEVWIAGPNACPICQEMDGTTVNIFEPFAREGDMLQGGDDPTEQGPLTITRDCLHAPLHDGCECDVSPG